ncbi:MAG: VanZ family protein [Bacteroidales bacterium]|jgi:VanZ family protein
MIRKLFFTSLIWAILILILCAVPGNTLPQVSLFNIPNLDKIIHAALYFPLAFILGAEFDLSKKNYLKILGPLFTMLIVAFYGGLIEIMQEYLFINRSADIVDLLADVMGGLGGLAIYYLFFRPFFHRLSERKP